MLNDKLDTTTLLKAEIAWPSISNVGQEGDAGRWQRGWAASQ